MKFLRDLPLIASIGMFAPLIDNISVLKNIVRDAPCVGCASKRVTCSFECRYTKKQEQVCFLREENGQPILVVRDLAGWVASLNNNALDRKGQVLQVRDVDLDKRVDTKASTGGFWQLCLSNDNFYYALPSFNSDSDDQTQVLGIDRDEAVNSDSDDQTQVLGIDGNEAVNSDSDDEAQVLGIDGNEAVFIRKGGAYVAILLYACYDGFISGLVFGLADDGAWRVTTTSDAAHTDSETLIECMFPITLTPERQLKCGTQVPDPYSVPLVDKDDQQIGTDALVSAIRSGLTRTLTTPSPTTDPTIGDSNPVRDVSGGGGGGGGLSGSGSVSKPTPNTPSASKANHATQRALLVSAIRSGLTRTLTTPSPTTDPTIGDSNPVRDVSGGGGGGGGLSGSGSVSKPTPNTPSASKANHATQRALLVGSGLLVLGVLAASYWWYLHNQSAPS